MAKTGIVGALPSKASKARGHGRATSNHPGPSSRRITPASATLPPLLTLAQDPGQPSFEERIVRTPSPSPVTDESGFSHLPLSFSFVTSLPEYDPRTSADDTKLRKQMFDFIWLETGRQWKKRYGTAFPRLEDKHFRNAFLFRRSPKEEDGEWEHMWFLQRREWRQSKFIAHLRKEGIQKRIQSWVETGIYHRESMEFWETISAPRNFRRANGTKTTIAELRNPKPIQPAPIGLWDAGGRWGGASSSGGSGASSVASIKDHLQTETLLRSPESLIPIRHYYDYMDTCSLSPMVTGRAGEENVDGHIGQTSGGRPNIEPSPNDPPSNQLPGTPAASSKMNVQPHLSNRSPSPKPKSNTAALISSSKTAEIITEIQDGILQSHETEVQLPIKTRVTTPQPMTRPKNKLQIELNEIAHEPERPINSYNPFTRTSVTPGDIKVPKLKPILKNGFERAKPVDRKERQTTKEKQARAQVEEQEHQGWGDESEKDIPIIGKQTSLDDIIRHLTESGCQDLTRSLNLATFSKYPVCHGGFSDVYRGCLEIGTQVAVKALRISEESIQNPKHLKRAARELHTWSSCQHRNVLQLLGLTIFQGRIGMVSPWLDCGDLPRYLKGTANVDRCNLCTQICDGLAYLHSIGIVHGDLKGANVLVLHDGTPVLGDFGNSILLGRKLQFTETTQQPSWSIRWAAPEFLHESDKQSEVADVYALGMASLTTLHKLSTILEVMTGEYPYDGKSDFMVVALVSQRKPPERPQEHIPTESSDGNKLWELLQRCWEYDPNKRPSAAEVTAVMGSITSQGLKAKNAL